MCGGCLTPWTRTYTDIMPGFHVEHFGCRAARADGEAVSAQLLSLIHISICQLDVFAPMGYSTIDLSEDSPDFPFSHRTAGSYLFLLS